MASVLTDLAPPLSADIGCHDRVLLLEPSPDVRDDDILVLVWSSRRRNRGRNVAQQHAVMARPVSVQDHIATSVVT